MTLTLALALEKAPSEDEKEKTIEDNGRTIRATRSPQSFLPIALPRTVSGPVPDIMDPIAETDPNVEDYSDLAMDEDDSILQDKVAEFKVRHLLHATACPSEQLSDAHLRPPRAHPSERHQDGWTGQRAPCACDCAASYLHHIGDNGALAELVARPPAEALAAAAGGDLHAALANIGPCVRPVVLGAVRGAPFAFALDVERRELRPWRGGDEAAGVCQVCRRRRGGLRRHLWESE
jgi:hypothetical protein